jgi:hypothetical protein
MKSVLTQSCISNNCEFFRISLLLKILKSSFLKWLWTLPVVIIIFFNCQQPHPPETFLQVGAIQVNAEKLTRYLKNFHQKQNPETLTPAAVLYFVQTELVDELRLLNAAQAENYSQHPEVLHKCHLMEKKFLTSGDGLIYRRFLADSLGVTEANTDNYHQQLEQYADALKQQLLDSVTISVNQPVFDAFYQKNYTSGYYFRKEILGKFSETERAQPFFAFDTTEVNLGEWIDYYRSYPMVRIIENRAMLHEHLEQFVFEQSAYHHAQKMGLLKDEKLLRFLDFYQQKQMVEIYLREKAAAEIQITEAEMQAEYENHPEKYRTEPIAGISTIEFLTHAAALAIIDSCRKNPEQFAELKQHYERQMQTQKEIVRFFTPSNIPYAPDSQVAFQLKIDSITAPIKIPKQKAYLLIKKMSHIPSKTLSFTAASAEIRKNLAAEKLPVFREHWEKELREKYKISINHQLISEYFKKQGRYLNN